LVRIYQIGEKQYPSVTSILSFVFGIGELLNRWSVKVAAEAMIKNIGLPEDALLKIAESARHQVLSKAQIKGRILHTWIETKNNGQDPVIDPEYEPYYKAFLKFLSEHKLTPVLQEYKVWNDVHQYAGRLDFYGFLDDIPVLLDFKTSKHLRPEYGLQLAAYRECLEKMGYPVRATFILHLRESGRYTLKEYNEPFQAFANLLPVFNWKMMHERTEISIASDEEAIKKEAQSSEELKTSQEQQSAQETNTQGHQFQQGDEELSPKPLCLSCMRPHTPSPVCPGLEDIQPHETKPESLEPVAPTEKRRRGRPRKDQAASTSLHIAGSQPRIPAEEEELDPSVARVA